MTGFRAGRRRLLLGAVAALPALRMPMARADVRLTLMTDFPVAAVHAPIYLAERKGWFKQAGIDLTVMDGKGSTSTINLVGAGRIDIGYANLGPLIEARQAGMKVVSVAGFTRKTDLAVLYRADENITRPQQLAGKRILCFAGSVWTPYIELYWKNNGVPPQNAPITNVDVNALYSTYAAGHADAIMTSWAHGFPIVNPTHPTKVFLATDANIKLPGYGLIVNETLLQRDPATLKKITTILVRAWDYMRNGHEQEALDAIRAVRPDARFDNAGALLELKIWEQLIDTPAAQGRPLGWQAQADWADAIRSQVAAGLIQPGHQPGEYFTNAMLAP